MNNKRVLLLPLVIAFTGLVIALMIYTGQLVSLAAIITASVYVLLGFLVFRKLKSSEGDKSHYASQLKAESVRVNKMTSFVETIASGNYKAELNLDTDENDELFLKLFKMQEKLRSTAEEDLKRNWVNTGLAKFGEILRSESDLQALSDNIISNLVKYLNANQGGLFVVEVNGNEQYLELKSAYAYDRKKFVNKKINPGQGLTGQCWLEGEKILMTDVPETFISITSGLGEALPRCILLMPLKVNEEIHGVVEIASFKVLEAYEIDFVEKLAESIASTISNAKVNATTKTLLEASQQQAEELKAQEEEMRQNMEELQATQEEMQRVSAEMSEQLRVINGTIATVEFDLSGNITDANDKFLALMGYNREEVSNKHHRIFVSAEEADSESYTRFWKDLASGQSFDGVFRRITKKGDAVWIKGMYSPILNSSGKPVKVVKFAYDVTAQKKQQAELEQSLEEITATQEEMERVSAEMSEQLRIINGTIATIEFDLSGNITDANDNFLALLGYTKEEVIGKHHKIFVSTDEVNSESYARFWKDLSAGQSFDGVFRRITKKGDSVWIKGMYSPILDNSGKPVKVVKFAYDVTAQKKQQAELEQSLEEITATQEEMERVSAEMSEQLRVINSTIATIEFDLSGNITDANDNFLALLGYTKEEVVGKHHKIFVAAEEANSESYSRFWKDLSAGQSFDGVFRRITKKGDSVWIKGMYSPILDNSGKPIKVVKFAYDVTAQKKQQAELEQSLEEITATQEEMERVSAEMSEQLRVINATIATIEFDLSGNITDANDNFLALLGYTKEEVVGKHHKIFVAAEVNSKSYSRFWKDLSAGESFDGVFRRITKKGDSVWIKGMYSPILDNFGKPVKVVKFAYDVTEQKKQEEQMQRQMEELKRLKGKAK